jgi:hypothetical protein
MSLNDTFKNGFFYWIAAAFLGAVVMAACQYLYPLYAPEGHEADLLLSGITRCFNQSLGNLCLMAGLLFAHLVFKGDFIGKVAECPRACAYVLCAVVLALAWINA